jgi:uncharacterized protein YdaT
MPWNAHRYPASMKHLPPHVQRKAIEIANALLKEGNDEGRCIRIAVWRAKRRGTGAAARMKAARARSSRRQFGSGRGA